MRSIDCDGMGAHHIAFCGDCNALHQLYSNILEENTASLRLFESVGFQNVGQKKEWRFFNGSYKNEYLLQYINHVL